MSDRPSGDEITIRPVPPSDASAAFANELADLWLRVSHAGGAVGFGTDAEPAEVEHAALGIADDIAAERTVLLAARHAGRLVGTVRLEPGAEPVVRHRAMLKLLMVAPDIQRSGLGRRLVDACLEAAAARGLSQVYLSARGGTGLEEYYLRLGWREVGRFPGGIRVAPGDDRDEVWYLRQI